MHLDDNYLRIRSDVFNLKADIDLSAFNIGNLLSPPENEIIEIQQFIEKISKPFIEADIVSIHHLNNQGTFHLLFELTDSHDKQFIVKTNKNNLPFPCYNFYIDQWVTHHLLSTNAVDFTVYTVDCSRNIVPFDFTIMDKISSQSLASLKNETQFDEYIHLLGKNLAQIHSHQGTKYGLINGFKLINQDSIPEGTHLNWHDYIYTNLEKHLSYCKAHSIINSEIYNELTHIFKTTESLTQIETSSLLHGDLNHHNIFVTDNHLNIIDWEDALCGDPIFDIAIWGTFVNHHEKLPLLLEGYQTISEIPDDFMRRYWSYYLRIIIAKTVVRHRLGYYKTDKIPAVERILFPLQQLKQSLSSKEPLCAY